MSRKSTQAAKVQIETPITAVVTDVVSQDPPFVNTNVLEAHYEGPANDKQLTEVVSTSYAIDGSQGNKLIIDAGSVSAAIRKLDAEGIKRGAIAKILNKRYQHVRNVLTTPLKKAD
jgi:hypothetical protein